MNYRHIYHAGNFADVFRHVLLLSLIESLLRKDKPFCYLDTHAGTGNYDLQTESAQKTQEFAQGIFKLWPLKSETTPQLITQYLDIIQNWNLEHGTHNLRYYPGSPVFVRKLLRSQDQMILTELHPQDALLLKQQFNRDKQVSVHHLDGYQGLKAFLPPKLSRGLVLIDPPFENRAEFNHITQHLQLALQRWHNGMYAVWYPIKNPLEVSHFYQALQVSGIRKILCCEMTLPPAITTHLNACGMLIINPPWQWADEASGLLTWLSKAFQATYRIEWLTPE